MKNLYLTSWGGVASHLVRKILCGEEHLKYWDVYPRDPNHVINQFKVFHTHWPEIPIINKSYTSLEARNNFKNHYYTNTVPEIDKDTTVVYLYGNPFNSLISFYGRNVERPISILHENGKEEKCGWVKKTCYWLGGNYDKINDDWTLDNYLNNGEDLFKWQENFDKWINSETDYSILFIRSEDMWENWDEIVWHLFGKSNLLDEIKTHINSSYKMSVVSLIDRHIKLPEKKQRNSDWTHLPEETKTKLFNLYGNLYDKVNNLPPVFLKEKK